MPSYQHGASPVISNITNINKKVALIPILVDRCTFR